MRKHLLVVASFFLFLTISTSSRAETDLTGTWVGQFKGVHINVPLAGRGPFSYRPQEAGRDPKPQFMEHELTVSIEIHEDNLLYGHWAIKEAGESPRRGDYFVCAMTNPNSWRCVDPVGTTNVEVLSATEMKICYFDSGSFGQGAGCANLKKAE